MNYAELEYANIRILLCFCVVVACICSRASTITQRKSLPWEHAVDRGTLFRQLVNRQGGAQPEWFWELNKQRRLWVARASVGG
jgi:hypothetical protein